jgi:hypothetical protein
MAKTNKVAVGDQYADIRSSFLQTEQPLKVTVEDAKGNKMSFIAGPKQFNSTSLGWYGNGKLMTVLSGGKPVNIQVGLTFTCIGSKLTA